jgi:hypothetical protein
MVSRIEIVAAAQSFVGLPFDPRLTSKGFLLAVADKLGLSGLDSSCLRGKHRSEAQPGDVVVVQFLSRTFGLKHSQSFTLTNAILTERNGVLHIVRPADGSVVEHIFDTAWRARVVQAFALQGVE